MSLGWLEKPFFQSQWAQSWCLLSPNLRKLVTQYEHTHTEFAGNLFHTSADIFDTAKITSSNDFIFSLWLWFNTNKSTTEDMTYLDDGQLDNPYSGRVSGGNYTEVITTKEPSCDGWSIGSMCRLPVAIRSLFLMVISYHCPIDVLNSVIMLCDWLNPCSLARELESGFRLHSVKICELNTIFSYGEFKCLMLSDFNGCWCAFDEKHDMTAWQFHLY